jgi:hypothetical protein
MGSEMRGPGASAPGPPHVVAPVARAWAVAAATAAMTVPAGSAEAEAWTVRGWADVAVGCVALDGPGFAGPVRRTAWRDGQGAFSGLDEVVGSLRVVSGEQHAARLRQLRRFAGPVPPWYPDTRPVAGPIRGIREVVWRAAALVAEFGERLIATAARLPHDAACPLVSARQLAWGVRYRPSPSEGHVTLRLPINRRLARRTWMCLPGLPAPATAIAEVPSTATPMAQQIWRGIHEGAHLDHLSSLARSGGPLAPSPGEFGAGLLVAESYAMAVEILAAVECVLAGEGHAVWQLGAGLIERATRLPGGANPAAEFADLPTLAEVYVLGPLEVLAGGSAAAALPAEITRSLHDRWRSACAAYPPAAAFGSAAAELVSQRTGLVARYAPVSRVPGPSGQLLGGCLPRRGVPSLILGISGNTAHRGSRGHAAGPGPGLTTKSLLT